MQWWNYAVDLAKCGSVDCWRCCPAAGVEPRLLAGFSTVDEHVTSLMENRAYHQHRTQLPATSPSLQRHQPISWNRRNGTFQRDCRIHVHVRQRLARTQQQHNSVHRMNTQPHEIACAGQLQIRWLHRAWSRRIIPSVVVQITDYHCTSNCPSTHHISSLQDNPAVPSHPYRLFLLLPSDILATFGAFAITESFNNGHESFNNGQKGCDRGGPGNCSRTPAGTVR